MANIFIYKLRKSIIWLVIIFCLLFAFRLIYGYSVKSEENTLDANLFKSTISAKRNYATKKHKVKNNSTNQNIIKVDQKYEKIADVKTKSINFDEDEKLSKSKIKEYNALIQFEQKNGNLGGRVLNLIVGVPPNNFDKLYNSLISIGNIKTKQITKKDKTNEYRELNAQKKSLEKTRTSLLELKSKGGKIDEYISLENRILDIEQQLQNLGISLGDFDEENEFCTVKFSIFESKENHIGILPRIKDSLEWTLTVYLQVILTLCFIIVFSYLFLLTIIKLKIIERTIKNRYNHE